MESTGGNSPRLTRRAWTALLTAAPLLAQATPTSPTSASPSATASKAASEVRQVSERLAQTEVPMSTEPAFSFRA